MNSAVCSAWPPLALVVPMTRLRSNTYWTSTIVPLAVHCAAVIRATFCCKSITIAFTTICRWK